ncbi:uncharacterized protein BO95DRAFT_459322 [Aspergillus brunneoviolaceus CBS 621.78]|uniref:Uncharacterized protein n=1 Tax=Aspergillus brunneoviolaceus CBS 621.78 TaxID=1450534 RepID=A0ACD1GMH7_9EURO|nr:hypothetical protein BO95DRAFT_459322 [Aspergillus brunneoviolaceus CBS 621.78]RAH50281.1 hypothetical protein BO95DRAFT_459322 [Aspergillus brunneoviolaceus CBS 621.78]
MSDSKQAARDQTAYQLNLSATAANTLQKQGEDSAKRRGKTFEPQELRFPNPNEENSMHQAETAPKELLGLADKDKEEVEVDNLTGF